VWNYQEIIFEHRIEHVVETGTRHGGSALFFAETLAARGAAGPVVSIDIDCRVAAAPGASGHPLPRRRQRRRPSGEPCARASADAPRPVFLILDSDHRATTCCASCARGCPSFERAITLSSRTPS
jgi:cephalosporin hydroxylase